MERSDDPACDCRRLAEPLPDHICFGTMIANARATIRDGVLPSSDRWSVPLNGRRVGFVIRQWVHEAGNATLANQLAKSRTWRAEVNRLRFAFQLWCADQPGEPIEAWINARRPLLVRLVDGPDHLAARLRRQGLPDTPAVVRHLRAAAAGLAKPLPARGLLVTTRRKTGPL